MQALPKRRVRGKVVFDVRRFDEFQSRIKKELTEGIVRAILDDAGYRVVDSGIENLVRELKCLTKREYGGLDYPKAMRALPDLVVMNREQTTKSLAKHLPSMLQAAADAETHTYEIEIDRYDEWIWAPVASLNAYPGQWWGLSTLQRVFPQIADRREEGTLMTAIHALQGILDTPEPQESAV